MKYCEPKLSFSFLHHMSGANASYLRKQMLQPSSPCGLRRAKSEKAFYEALCVLHASGVSSTQKYEAHFVLASFARQASKYMKHACRRMRRSLTASCFFCLGIKAKKMVGVAGVEPATSCSQSKRASHCATPRLVIFSEFDICCFTNG